MNPFRNFLTQASHPTRIFIATLVFVCASHAGAFAKCSQPDRFAPNDDEIADRQSGLVWKRCSVGLEWLDVDGCRGEISGLTLPEAEAAAQRAGAGWRLPTADELLALVMRDCGEPAIDETAFPDIPLDVGGEASLYWTSTPAGMLDMSVTVDFRYGFYDMHSRGLKYFVRLVRSQNK